jgi:antirestriction protein ArdC
MAQAAGYRTPRYLTFKQASELGGHVRKGERGTKVYFVKQLEIRGDADDNSPTRLIPVMRETAKLIGLQIQIKDAPGAGQDKSVLVIHTATEFTSKTVRCA